MINWTFEVRSQLTFLLYFQFYKGGCSRYFKTGYLTDRDLGALNFNLNYLLQDFHINILRFLSFAACTKVTRHTKSGKLHILQRFIDLLFIPVPTCDEEYFIGSKQKMCQIITVCHVTFHRLASICWKLGTFPRTNLKGHWHDKQTLNSPFRGVTYWK